MAAGLVIIVRRRGSRGDLPALLDAAILAAGTAVVVGVFVIAPIADDSSLTFLGKLTSSVYPVGDVLLLGILARLWTTPGARTTAFKLLAGCLAVTLFADALYNYTALQGGDGDLPAGQRRALAGELRADRRSGVVALGPRPRRAAPGTRGPCRPDEADGRPHRSACCCRRSPCSATTSAAEASPGC